MSATPPPTPERPEGSFWSDAAPAGAGRAHSRVFGLGVVTIVGTVLGLAGLTWAGVSTSTKSVDAQASAAPSPTHPALPGTCAITLDGKTRPIDLSTARTLTMVAAVGQQVAAPDLQTARAIDVALTRPATPATRVTDALALLAADDVGAPADATLEELRALAVPGSMSCTFAKPKAPVESKAASGLTPRAAALRLGFLDAFGKLPTSGWTKPAPAKKSPAKKTAAKKPAAKAAPAPVTAAAVDALAAAEGRAVDVAFTVASAAADAGDNAAEAARARGWLLAYWLVAHGDTYRVNGVSYDDQVWSATTGTGWQPAVSVAPTAPASRLHVTVARGN